MNMLIHEFYVSEGDMQSLLEAEKYRLESSAQFPHTLPPDMDNFLLEEIIPAFEKALEIALTEPASVRLSRVPFAAFSFNASYTICPDEGCYKVELHAPKNNPELTRDIKNIFEKHGFKEIDKKWQK